MITNRCGSASTDLVAKSVQWWYVITHFDEDSVVRGRSDGIEGSFRESLLSVGGTPRDSLSTTSSEHLQRMQHTNVRRLIGDRSTTALAKHA